MDALTTTEEIFDDEAVLKSYEKNTELLETVRAYLLSLNDYPLLSAEEEKELLYQYKVNGDQNAREKLIKHNLKLVVWYVKNNKKITKSYQFLDLIQEGNIGLIKAIDRFDIGFPNRLSTYAIPWIRQVINRKVDDQDETIRISVHMKGIVQEYYQFISEFTKKNHREPTRQEIQENLSYSDEQYKKLIEIISTLSSVESLNKTVGEEEDSSLEDFVADKANGYETFETNLDEKILFYKLKKHLNESEYYLIYHYILNGEGTTYEQIGETLGITRERIRQLINKVLEKIKRRDILNKPAPQLSKLDKFDARPIDFRKKVILIYLKDKISTSEYYYFYYGWYQELEEEGLKRKLAKYGMNSEDIGKAMDTMCKDIIRLTDENYQSILEQIKKKYTRSQIFSADVNVEDENLLKVEQELKRMSKEQRQSLLEEESLSPSQRELIEEYFDDTYRYIAYSSLNLVEAKINVQRLYYKGERHIPLAKLFKVYQDNISLFEEEYQTYLEGTLFSSCTGQKVKYNKLFQQREGNTLIRLEQLYYQIDNIFQYELPEKEIKRILKEYDYLFTEHEIAVITLRHIKHYSVRETAQLLGVDFEVIRAQSGPFFDKVLNLSLGCFKTNVIKNEEVYIRYINNPRFEMSEMGRKVCKLRFEQHLDYNEIANILGIKTTQQVSNFIGKVTHLVDDHYYNVFNETIYEEEKVYELLENKKEYTPLEKEICIARFVENQNADTICKNFAIDKKEYNRIANKFINQYINYFAAKDITKEDILTEIHRHSSDQVLTEIQQKIIALAYGVKCKWNEKGETLSKKEIIIRLGITEITYANNYQKAKHFLGARKNGIIGAPLGRLSREEIIKFLKDPNIPLTDEEKILLCQIKGIGGKTYTIEELAKIHNVNNFSIKRRLTNCYVSILKYVEGKKEKQLNFEVDILPLLKYFPLFRQNLLRDIYEKKLTIKEISKKYKYTQHYTLQVVNEVERKILYYLKYPAARKFDYDYARSVLMQEDLPYYGNKEVALAYYIRYFGEDGNPPASRGELIEDLNIGDNTKTSFMVRDLMIATLRYKDGIRKINSFTKEEITEHYQQYQENMYSTIRKIFEFTIEKGYRESLIHQKPPNDLVIYELLKRKTDNLIRIEDLSIEETIKLIRENPYHLTPEQLEWVRNNKQLPKRIFMSGKRKRKVLSSLAPFVLNNENTYTLAKKG